MFQGLGDGAPDLNSSPLHFTVLGQAFVFTAHVQAELANTSVTHLYLHPFQHAPSNKRAFHACLVLRARCSNTETDTC